MGLFSLFKGKDVAGHEAVGDRYMEEEDWGQAKLAYEDAQAKLAKQFPPPADSATIEERLKAKRGQCMEELARGHFQQGEELMASGHPEEAREYFELARELSDNPTLAVKIQAHLEASASMEIILPPDAPPMPAEPQVHDGEQVDDPDEYFEALISTLPEEVRGEYQEYGSNFKVGYVALNQGDFTSAVKELTQARNLNPEPENYIPLELATAHFNLGQQQSAQVLLEEFLSHHPDNLPAYRLLCEIFWEKSRFEQVEELLESLPNELRDTLEYYLLKGETMMRAGRYDEAETLYRSFIETYGWNQEISLALAGALETGGDLVAARGLYGELMSQCQGCGTRIPPPIKRKFADLCMATDQRGPSVLELYLTLTREDPAHAPYYYRQVSALYDHLGNTKEALRFQQIAEGMSQQASEFVEKGTD